MQACCTVSIGLGGRTAGRNDWPGTSLIESCTSRRWIGRHIESNHVRAGECTFAGSIGPARRAHRH